MSDQERKDMPSESAPDEGRESWPVEDAPVGPEELEDRLGNRIEETADAVTQGLRDLQVGTDRGDEHRETVRQVGDRREERLTHALRDGNQAFLYQVNCIIDQTELPRFHHHLVSALSYDLVLGHAFLKKSKA